MRQNPLTVYNDILNLFKKISNIKEVELLFCLRFNIFALNLFI